MGVCKVALFTGQESPPKNKCKLRPFSQTPQALWEDNRGKVEATRAAMTTCHNYNPDHR